MNRTPMNTPSRLRAASIRAAAMPIAAGIAALLASHASAQIIRPDATMLREPGVSRTHIVFGYANDLWIVPREGGAATPLASPPGRERFPRFSPDGKTIAFQGNYDGDRDLYTIPVAGGPAQRITHHPGEETLLDWINDDELLFRTPDLSGYRRLDQLFRINADGGHYRRLPVVFGSVGSISPDGDTLAFTPYTRDERTWKRYRGGWATDIWLFDLNTLDSERITDWEGTDTQPMFAPGNNNIVYYLSDAGPNHRLNIWSYNRQTRQKQQVTNFDRYDCKWPSMGPGPDGRGEIILQNGQDLYLIALPGGQATRVQVTIPGDRPAIRPMTIDAADHVQAVSLSATGKRILVEARGDLWSLPATEGVTRQLTSTSGIAERDPVSSPDGKTIAFFSDAEGEYHLYTMPLDASAQPSIAARLPEGYYSSIGFSPDSKHLVFGDNAGQYWLHSFESGQTRVITQDLWASLAPVSWSHDSGWMALQLGNENSHDTIHLYEVATGTLTEVTSDMMHSSNPVFDAKGEFLYFVTPRSFNGAWSSLPGDASIVFENMDNIVAVPLRNDVKSPMLPKSDEEEPKDDEDDKDKDTDKDNDKEGDSDSDSDNEPADEDADAEDDAEDAADDAEADDADADDDKEDDKPIITIDLEGFESRAMRLPMPDGSYGGLLVNKDNALVFSEFGDGGAKLQIFDMHADDPEVKTIIEGWRLIAVSGDRAKALVGRGNNQAVISLKPSQKAEDTVPKDAMTTTVDPRQEWEQIFVETWRLFRDFFYTANLHGVDWEAVRAEYEPMLADCVVRDDLTWVIQEMISELNVGHAYYRPGTLLDQEPSQPVGMLGADYELVTQDGATAYRITNIVTGAPWDIDAKGPLSEPGVDVKEGDFLLAVNGRPINTDIDPWAAFIGLAGRTVELTVSDKPTIDDSARRVLVTTLRSETPLRFREWIESTRKYIHEQSDGKIGYAYVQNTSPPGQTDLYRQFAGQKNMEAMIIDDRWNGGGWAIGPGIMVDMLSRKRTNYWAVRHGRDWAYPNFSHSGPKAMLINGLSASGGDMFPYLFKQAKLGPLVGTRTWGGLVGLSGNPTLIDGTAPSIPTFAFYELDGTWGIEGHGVDPDIEAIDDPSALARGRDAQVDAAIEHLLKEIQRNPYRRPPTPKAPDRTGMGLPIEDR
ncbi:MAG: S41 family peptidase [Phycisphaerales bacterium]